MSIAHEICYIASVVHSHRIRIEGQSLEKSVGEWYSEDLKDLGRESENASNNVCKLNLRSMMCAKVLKCVGMVSLYDSRGGFI